jgi:hypothetical protein
MGGRRVHGEDQFRTGKKVNELLEIRRVKDPDPGRQFRGVFCDGIPEIGQLNRLPGRPRQYQRRDDTLPVKT